MSSIFREYTPEGKRSDRSARDRARHREKIQDSIRDNIADILAEESIIGRDQNKVIKIPIKSVKEYRFIYGDNAPNIAQGTGQQKPGDIVGPADPGAPNAGSGQGGNQPGVDILETDITLEELISMMFEDLELPELERKSIRQVLSSDGRRRKGLRTNGIRPRLNKKETSKNRIKRQIAAKANRGADFNNEDRFPFHEDDMRFFHITETEQEVSNAVIFCIMDTSGSMGTIKKYLARSFYFLLYQFVKQKYTNVEVVFVAHHTEAKEVTEEEFFHKVESGGTYISSGYKKALEIIDQRYHPSLWNIYAFHCSDGDNFYSDNDLAVEEAKNLCKVCNLFGYGEIKPSGSAYYSGSMLEIFSKVNNDNFHMILIEKKEDLWTGFRSFLSKDQTERNARKIKPISEGASSAT